MQETRQLILEYLKKHEFATVNALSDELGLTSVTIRHHLEILRAEGYITDPQVKHCDRPGRPCYVYGLTTMAADLFPSNYCGLVSALLTAMEDVTPKERQLVLRAAGKELAAGKGELPTDSDERLLYTSNYLRKLGFVSRWERDAEGHDQLHICNCPYQYAVVSHPELCEVDKAMLQELTEAEVVHLSAAVDAETLCIYQINWGE